MTEVDKDKNVVGENIWIWCPGCDEAHTVRVSSTKGAGVWGWNGSMDAPTFTPSLLINASDPNTRCHSFIKNGEIQFLSDCHHKLRGQTVPLAELPDWLIRS